MGKPRQQAQHLIRVNYMGIADKIKEFRKPYKRKRAVTTAHKTK
jgi:hypothetical protein